MRGRDTLIYACWRTLAAPCGVARLPFIRHPLLRSGWCHRCSAYCGSKADASLSSSRAFDFAFCCLKSLFDNLTLGTSISFVTITAPYRVIGSSISCGTRALNSNPRGPKSERGKRLIHSGTESTDGSVGRPTAE